MEANITAVWWGLLASTALIAVVHAAAGPDHYLPFIAIGMARKWTRTKAFAVVLVSGIAHVLSSVVIGAVGIAAGIGLESLKFLEGTRGTVAGWLLIFAGALYLAWSLRPRHHHAHAEDIANDPRAQRRGIIFWVFVAVIVLGPCEPLIPLMFVAVQISWAAVAAASLLFLILTLAMMELFVLTGLAGVSLLPKRLTHHLGNAFAGLVIIGLGIALMLFA